MKDKLKLKGQEYCMQEWVKSKNIVNIKYSSNKSIKNDKRVIFRSTKQYSLLY